MYICSRSDIDLQFQRLIEGPLTKNQGELLRNPPVIVLDALDECSSGRSRSDQRKTLLDTLAKWRNLPQVFKLIVTSRDERLPISFRQVCEPMVLETGSRVSSGTSDDIRLFLRSRFADISNKYPSLSLSKWPGEPIIERLTRRASGLFIWADTLVRFVDNGKCPPDDQLDLVLRGDIVSEEDIMSELYQRILDVSFGKSDVNVLNAFHAIVGTIIVAKVPLVRNDLAYFLDMAVKKSVVDFILNKLSSVISVGTDGMIHICHLSFADFISDATRSLKYAINHAELSVTVASACFRLMKAGLKFNICSLKTSHLSNDDVPDLPACIQKSISTRLSYACRFGLHHLRDTPHDGPMRVNLFNDVDSFLHVQFLYWLEVMSLIKEVRRALAALLGVVLWIGVRFRSQRLPACI